MNLLFRFSAVLALFCCAFLFVAASNSDIATVEPMTSMVESSEALYQTLCEDYDLDNMSNEEMAVLTQTYSQTNFMDCQQILQLLAQARIACDFNNHCPMVIFYQNMFNTQCGQLNCNNGAGCPTGFVCDSGNCVPELQTPDLDGKLGGISRCGIGLPPCPADYICSNGQCIPL